jgi:hypothetical protein
VSPFFLDPEDVKNLKQDSCDLESGVGGTEGLFTISVFGSEGGCNCYSFIRCNELILCSCRGTQRQYGVTC